MDHLLPLTSHSFQCLLQRLEDEVNAFEFAVPQSVAEKEAFHIGAREAKALLQTATELNEALERIQAGGIGGFTAAQLAELSFLGFDTSVGAQNQRECPCEQSSASVSGKRRERFPSALRSDADGRPNAQVVETQNSRMYVKPRAVDSDAPAAIDAGEFSRLREEVARLRGCLLGQGFASRDDRNRSQEGKQTCEDSLAREEEVEKGEAVIERRVYGGSSEEEDEDHVRSVQKQPEPPLQQHRRIIDPDASALDLVHMIRQAAAEEEEAGRRRVEAVRNECTIALQRMRRDFMCAMHLQETKRTPPTSIGARSVIIPDSERPTETLTSDAMNAQSLLSNDEDLATFYATAKAVELWCHMQDRTAQQIEYRLTTKESRTADEVDQAVIALLNRLRLPFPVCIRRLDSGGDYYIDRRVKIKFNHDGDLVVRECSGSVLPDQPYVLLAQYILHLYSPLLDLKWQSVDPIPMKANTSGFTAERRGLQSTSSLLQQRHDEVRSQRFNDPEQGADASSATETRAAAAAAARLEMLLDQHANLSTQIRDQETHLTALRAAAASSATPPRINRELLPTTLLHHHNRSQLPSMISADERWRYPPSPSPSRFVRDLTRTADKYASASPFGDVGKEYQCPSKSLEASPAAPDSSQHSSRTAPAIAVEESFLREEHVLSPRVRRVIETMYSAGKTIPDLSQFTVAELQELREETYRIQRAQQLIASPGTP